LSKKRPSVDDDDAAPPPRSSRAKAASVDDDEAPAPKKRHASVDDDDEAPAQKATPKSAHHASVDDDDDAPVAKSSSRSSGRIESSDREDSQPAPARAFVEDEPSSSRHETVDSVEAEAGAHGASHLPHKIAIAAGLDGGTWFYGLSPNNASASNINTGFYPGGSLRVDAWPLAYNGIDFFGIDGEIAGAGVPFVTDGASPASFTAVQMRAGIFGKLRYTFDSGAAVGVRAGYRYFGASTQPQSYTSGGVSHDVTFVPGYTTHALAVGLEGFVPFTAGGHAMEFEARAEALPLTRYLEHPDMPGATASAWGYSASVGLRYDIVSGFFIEGRGESTGVRATFDSTGTRSTVEGARVIQLDGGHATNLMAGATIALGYML
jgi:hypothetical protein